MAQDSSLSQFVLVTLVIIILFIAILIVIKISSFIYWLRVPKTTLRLTPNIRHAKDARATAQLFSALYGLSRYQTLVERALHRRTYICLEISGSKREGIVYEITVPTEKALTLQRIIAAYDADIQITSVPKREKVLWKNVVMQRIKTASHFAFPLQHVDTEQHDPVTYLVNAMTQLNDHEKMTLQLVIRAEQKKEAGQLARQVLVQDDIIKHLKTGNTSHKLLGIINKINLTVLDSASSLAHSSYSARSPLHHHQSAVLQGLKPKRSISPFESELIETIHTKLKEPLFSTSIRTLVISPTRRDRRVRNLSLNNALQLLDIRGYQSLRAKKVIGIAKMVHMWLFQHFVMDSYRSVLSTSELASLFHFPTREATVEHLSRSLHTSLPAPLAMAGKQLDIVFGENMYKGKTTQLGLSEDERARHMYVVGGTGNGKTTMLLNGIVQDIKSGKGVAVIDPHGDLAETILGYIPEDRKQDVIYVNPDDLMYPVRINLLELTPGLAGDDLLREKDLVTESTISVMRKIFSEDDTGGHRIEYVLRNAIQTALTIPGANIFTIFRLLNDAKYRRIVTKNLDDEDLKNFWNNELGKAGDFQRVKMAAGITAKIGRFLFSASAKGMLEQEKSTINFDVILDSSKILICNFSKGLLGEDTSALFGTTILAKLQMAALKRARTAQADRRPFYLYVDEFQNFATMSFVQMLSEARKYKLFLTMAEQSTSQQDQQRLVDIILANVGTIICFRSGSPADERMVLPLFKPFIAEGEIANLPVFTFYARIAAIEASEPMSGQTLLLTSKPDVIKAEEIKQLSRTLYSQKKKSFNKEKTAFFGSLKKVNHAVFSKDTIEPID